jgi:hypothetical protein
MAQWESDKQNDRQQAMRLRRKGQIGALVTNVRLYMENESKKSATFRRSFPATAQQGFVAVLERWLPDRVRRIVIDTEIAQAQREVIAVFGTYWKGKIPLWLHG